MKWCLLMPGTAFFAENKNSKFFAATLPPDFWMWKTTPAPPTPPGPSPQVLWVEQTAPPLPTLAPSREACYGCDCLFVFADELVKGGTVTAPFTCGSGKRAPSLNWAGAPQNGGVGHPLTQSDGTACPRSQSFAVVVEDLDYPHGIGQGQNKVFTHFWAVNIPGDWNQFNDAMAAQTYKGLPLAVVGKNDFGDIGLTPMCPRHGVHRYRFTLWALKAYLGSEEAPLSPDTPYAQILPQLESYELARSAFYANVKAVPQPGFFF